MTLDNKMKFLNTQTKDNNIKKSNALINYQYIQKHKLILQHKSTINYSQKENFQINIYYRTISSQIQQNKN